MSFTASQKHLFYTEIAKLLEAGFGIREAARAMLDTRLPAVQAGLLREMDRSLEGGASIAESFGKDSPSIGQMERSIIAAGERGGRMGPAFQHLASYFGMLAAARREALQAMAYPVALLHLGLLVAVVAPGLMAGEKGFGGLLMQFLLVLAALYAGLFLAGLTVRAVLAAAPERPSLERAIGRIPVLGSARRSMAMARFTKVYHACLLAGLSMKETVETACTASHNGVIREAGRRLQAALDQGAALGPVFLASEAFPPAFARSYATAEEAGGLDKDLGRWADFFQDEAGRRVKTASAVISKAVYFAVLLFVAWTIIHSYTSRYNEMFEMLDD